jgi:hypothetical protein
MLKAVAPIVAVPVHSVEKPLSFTDAAERVLEEFAGKKPMHYRAVTAKALERGLVKTAGQTPESTLYAQVLTEITRSVQRGESPRFIKHGKGLIGLSRWVRPGLAAQIEQHNAARRKQLHARLLSMPPTAFEALIGKLLAALGFVEVSVTKASGDGGIDVRGTMVVGDVIRTQMAVQVKRWKNNVQAPVVMQVRGSLGAHEQGLIVTTSDFSSGAREEAESPSKTPGRLNERHAVGGTPCRTRNRRNSHPLQLDRNQRKRGRRVSPRWRRDGCTMAADLRFAVDFGTTNSVVAVAEQGSVRVVPCRTWRARQGRKRGGVAAGADGGFRDGAATTLAVFLARAGLRRSGRASGPTRQTTTGPLSIPPV